MPKILTKAFGLSICVVVAEMLTFVNTLLF